MAIPVFDQLTADNSGNYKLSIRLQPDGLSFSGYSVSVGGEFFYKEVLFDRNKTYMSSLKDFFFEQEFLSYTFKRIDIIISNPYYTLIPRMIFQENQKESIFALLFGQTKLHIEHHALSFMESEFMFGLNDELYEFCSRSLVNPKFIHSLIPLLHSWSKHSSISLPGQCYVMIQNKQLDIAYFRQGKLITVNTYTFNQLSEVIYFVLYTWQQNNFDSLKDHLNISAEMETKKELISKLGIYIQNITPLEIPAEAFLLGSQIAHAPLDLIALSLCE